MKNLLWCAVIGCALLPGSACSQSAISRLINFDFQNQITGVAKRADGNWLLLHTSAQSSHVYIGGDTLRVSVVDQAGEVLETRVLDSSLPWYELLQSVKIYATPDTGFVVTLNDALCDVLSVNELSLGVDKSFQLKWRYPLEPEFNNSSPLDWSLTADGTLLGVTGTTLFELDPASGASLNSWALGNPFLPWNPKIVDPATRGVYYFVDSRLNYLQPAQGLQWSVMFPGPTSAGWWPANLRIDTAHSSVVMLLNNERLATLNLPGPSPLVVTNTDSLPGKPMRLATNETGTFLLVQRPDFQYEIYSFDPVTQQLESRLQVEGGRKKVFGFEMQGDTAVLFGTEMYGPYPLGNLYDSYNNTHSWLHVQRLNTPLVSSAANNAALTAITQGAPLSKSPVCHISGGQFSATVKNVGADTLRSVYVNASFEYDSGFMEYCPGYYNKQLHLTDLTLAPDSSQTFFLGDIFSIGCIEETCFWVSAPNESPDADQSDNVTCLELQYVTATTELVLGAVQASPNPFRDQVVIQIPDAYPAANWALYDVAGQVVLNGQTSTATPLTLRTEALPSGLYVFKMNTNHTPIQLVKVP